MPVQIRKPTDVSHEGNPLPSSLYYASRGWKVVPIHTPLRSGKCSCGRLDCIAIGKHPRIDGWVDDATTEASKITEWWTSWPVANVGIAFGADTGLIDIEVDPRNGGTASMKQMVEKLGELPPTLMYTSGGGGKHRLFLYPEGARIRKVTHLGKRLLGRKKTGIDVLSDGGQAVAPPSRHASGRRYLWDNNLEPAELPATWLALLVAAPSTTDGVSAEDELLLNGTAVLPDIDIAKARKVLEFISPDNDYNEWIVIGQALKIQFPTDPAALDLFDEWSQRSPEKYPGREKVEYTWSTLGRKDARGDQVTFRSVLALAKEAGYRPPRRAAPDGKEDEYAALRREDEELKERFSAQMQETTTDSELTEIAAEIRRTELFEATRDALTEDYQSAYKRIHEKKLSKKTASEVLSDSGEREARAKEMADRDGWFKSFVYVQEGKLGSFFNTETRQELSGKTFDETYSAKLVTPVRRAQGLISPIYLPSSLLLNCDLVEKVAAIRYVPGKPLIFEDEDNGLPHVNSYRAPSGESADPLLWSAEEKATVAAVEKHLTWMLGKERAQLMRQFLGYIYQKPGQRVRWCFTIVGPKGIGKSYIGSLARAALGSRNVRDVDQAALGHTTFNAWAVGSQLNVIEEIKVDGTKKWEIMNSLKAVITNDVIDVHRKGADSYNVPNTANYIAFTNHENALALTGSDRRYFVANTTFSSVAAFRADLGGLAKLQGYYKPLYDALSLYPEAIRGWLSTVDLTGFDPSCAPESAESDDMASYSRSDLEVSIWRILDSGEPKTCNRVVIELDALKDALGLDPDVGQISGQQLGRTLREMGFRSLSHDGLAPFDSRRKSRWFYSPDEIRKLNISVKDYPPTKLIRLVIDRQTP